ncbi:MAG TPA: flagellar hook-associated protein FlgL [Marmoricola sp.]|jgi:flagellar hook-associated protein 3 FlgL|nr:flagellar hook-associated protein FlgL [Marmoricola sp.]
MALQRVTDSMMVQSSLAAMQGNLAQLAATQQQLTSGRKLNVPSDNPTDTTSAMRLRSSIADQTQYSRNAEDGDAWLGQADTALTSANDQLLRAQDLALQGANQGSASQTSLDALASEVDQIKAGMIDAANTTYLGRPVFGGVTAGVKAYDASGAYVGTPGTVDRTIAPGTTLRVDTDGQAAFGPTGDSVFDHLTALSTALRAGDSTGITAGIAALKTDQNRISAAQTDVGTRQNRIEAADQTAQDKLLSLQTSLTSVENVDLPKTIMNLQMQQTAYQASLAATSRVMQQSLLDYLR